MSQKTPKSLLPLFTAAKKMRLLAHSPYSGFKVGAALRDSKGKIHAGCNVENSTYGATVCAERNAIANMVMHGGKSIKEVLVMTPEGWFPCGICRQVLVEFAPDPSKVTIHIANTTGYLGSYRLSDLIPAAFSGKDMKKKR